MSADLELPLTYRGKFVVRALGTIFLTACCAMLVLGQTLLRDDLAGPQFLLYWSWCFLITLLAGMMAILDLMLVRRASRKVCRELIQHDLTEPDQQESAKHRSSHPTAE